MVDKRLLPEHDIDKRQYAVTPVLGGRINRRWPGVRERKRMNQGGNRHAG